jgi:hypothetical protein
LRLKAAANGIRISITIYISLPAERPTQSSPEQAQRRSSDPLIFSAEAVKLDATAEY